MASSEAIRFSVQIAQALKAAPAALTAASVNESEPLPLLVSVCG